MARVMIIPGLAVRRYAEPAAAALRSAGHRVELTAAPGWRGVPLDLADYGRWLASRMSDRAVDLLVGLSVGTQVAVVTATQAPVGHLLLVSPTVDPAQRTLLRLLRAWSAGEDGPGKPPLRRQVGDWRHAGPARLIAAARSATETVIEDLLDRVDAPVTVVHAGADTLSPLAYALTLGQRPRVRGCVMPDAPHSWPVADEHRFVGFVEALLAAAR